MSVAELEKKKKRKKRRKKKRKRRRALTFIERQLGICNETP